MLKKQINKISQKTIKPATPQEREVMTTTGSNSFNKGSAIFRKPEKKSNSKKTVKSTVKSNSFASAQKETKKKKPPGYDSMLKKGPVNIFNIKNYNILKSDKTKHDSEDLSLLKRNDSLKGAPKPINGKKGSCQKVHNFFVFINNKEGQEAKKKSLAPGNNSSFQKDSALEQRYIKLANLIKRYPIAEKSRKVSVSGNKKSPQTQQSHNDSSLFSNEWINFSEKIQNFTNELVSIREDGPEEPVGAINSSARTQNTVRLMSNLNGKPLGVFLPTKKKVLNIMDELKKITKRLNDFGPDKAERAMQTDPESLPMLIPYSNLNMMNLMKEVAKEVLVKGKMAKSSIENLEDFCEKMGMEMKSIDPEKQEMIKYIFTSYQEQLIFEEALSILQEKGVDLENLFVYAYERLKIKISETPRNTVDGDSEPSFTVVTDVSLPSISGAGEIEGKMTRSIDARGGNIFALDFNNLIQDDDYDDTEGD